MVQTLLALALVIHGAVHLMYFAASWRFVAVGGVDVSHALFGRVALAGSVARLFGLVWLAVAVGFAAAAFGVWTDASWAFGFTLGVTLVSLAICLLALPDGAFGVIIDVLILVALAYVQLNGAVTGLP
jgi:hypothetical protein